jgi:hypothetical protein
VGDTRCKSISAGWRCYRTADHDDLHYSAYTGSWCDATEPTIYDYAKELAELVTAKAKAYGNSTDKSGKVLAILYPDGIKTHQYSDVLLVARVIDKLGRIAQRKEDGKDLAGESPWKDLAGYGLLGWKADKELGKDNA